MAQGTSTLRRKRFSVTPLVLLMPALIFLVGLSGYPIVRLFINSFQTYGRAQLMGAPAPWVGWRNYVSILTSSSFLQVALRSFLFMVVAVTLTIVLGTLISILMTKLPRFFRLLTTVGLLLAWAMPALTATIVFGWMLDTDYGVINYLLTKITGHDWIGHQWLLNPVSFYAVLAMIIVWQGIPFVAFTVYAAMTGISGEVIEAAQIDQAGPIKRFFLIELPYIRPVLTVLIVLSVIWDLRVFAQVYALQGIGGIAEQTSTLGVWIYQQGSSNVGLSSAAAVIMLLIMLIISVAYVRQTLSEGD